MIVSVSVNLLGSTLLGWCDDLAQNLCVTSHFATNLHCRANV